MQTYGYDQDQWDRAKDEARSFLIELAASRLVATYTLVTKQIETIRFTAQDHRYHNMLGQISISEHKGGKGMLSGLVVTARDRMPGDGFFRVARMLGFQFDSKEAFWKSEMGKVTNYYSRHFPRQIFRIE